MSTKVPRRRIAITFAAIFLAALMFVWAVLQDQRQGSQIDALYAALGDSQTQIENLGGDPVAPAPEDLLEDPEYSPQPGPSGPPGPPGPGLSESEIEAAFASYFAEHPYQFEPSAAELTAAFASVLADHPDLLTDQLYAAMAAYLAENPPPPGPPGTDGKDGANGSNGADGKDGADGATGDPGRPPTPEEIREQVETVMAENPPPPACPEGSDFGVLTVLTVGVPTDIVACVVSG